MPQLIVQDPDGKTLISRPILEQEFKTYYQAWIDAELVSFDSKRFRLHSIAVRRPGRDMVLCVSFDSYDPEAYIDC